MSIEARTQRCLEWDKIKQYLAKEADCAPGAQRCAEIEVHHEPLVITILLEETDEALSMLGSGSGFLASGLRDLTEILGRLKAGGTLVQEELLAIHRLLVLSRKASSSISLLSREAFPRITSFASKIFSLEPLAAEIDGAIDPSGEVRDEASVKLRNLRREVHRLDNQIKDELNRLIHNSNVSKALQEPIYTQRNGRYVLPVTASSHYVVEGIVHDSSASGLTVYIEPAVVVELSNKVRMTQAEIEREISRILEELTFKTFEKHAEIVSSYETVVELDFIMARARLASKYGGVLPELSEDGSINLLNARHPLLVLQNYSDTSKKVIGNDVRLGGSERTLVITGPNTGGKTVLLKTIGLLSIMLCAGLLLPVGRGSKAAVFPVICADIGDEQSLEQSLSTFSSHMLNIVEIVDKAGPGMLVLLDEVGAGTDPKEGAAIARAVLEYLNDSQVVTVATTHYGELKTLAYTDTGFINGSLEFDDSTLTPTYKLRLGVPGSSKATTIASRLGLNADVVSRAQSLVESSDQDVQIAIDQLKIKQEELIEKEKLLETELARTQTQEQSNRLELERRYKEIEEKRSYYSYQLESDFKETKDKLRSMVSELQRQPSLAKAQKAQQDLLKLKEDLGWLNEQSDSLAGARAQVGQTVRVRSLNKVGVVESIKESDSPEKGDVTIRVGGMRLKSKLDDLEVLGQQATPARPKQNLAKPVMPSQSLSRGRGRDRHDEVGLFVRGSNNTLDLRGQRVEAALTNLERFLDSASLQSMSPVMIIHGHGTGAIRRAVREYLDTSGYVRAYRPGEMNEGGDGVTIVDLD